MKPVQSITAIVPCSDLDESEAFYNRLGFSRPNKDRLVVEDEEYRILYDADGASIHLTKAVPGWLVPGALVLRLMLVAALAVALSGAVAAWLVTRASGQEAMRRVVSQQTDEVEVVARLLASKIEQSQKVLRTVAAGITPAVLESPSSLEWLLQQGLPAVQFFDTMQVARDNGELRLNLRAGQIEKAADLDPAERDALRRVRESGASVSARDLPTSRTISLAELIDGH